MQIVINKGNTAFTIIEVLLALALMGLVAGLFAVNFDVLLSSISQKRPEKVLHEAICEARYQTLQEHSRIYLSFDEVKHAFLIFKDSRDSPIVKMPVKEGIKVTFEPIFPREYKGGQFEEVVHSKKPVDEIAFAPDGSSQPVIITLVQGNYSLQFKPDPLSCGITLI